MPTPASPLTLRITQVAEAEGRYRVELALEGGSVPRQPATAHFDFELAGQDREDLRWYLEGYLQNPSYAESRCHGGQTGDSWNAHPSGTDCADAGSRYS